MNDISTNQNEFIRFFQIILRKKWIIIGCIVLIQLPIIYLNMTSLPVYNATTKIVFEEKKPVISDLDVTQLSFKGSYVLNLIEEIESWSLMNEVTNALSDSILNTFVIQGEIPSQYNNKNDYLTYIIEKNVSARPIPKTDVIAISAQAHNAKVAAVIANTTAELLIKRNLNSKLGEINQVKNTVEDQLKYFSQKVQESENALKIYKEANKITYLDKESEEIFKRITEAEVEYNKTVTELNASRNRLAFVKDKLSQEREELVPYITTITSPWAQELKKKLVDLEVQYTTLRVQDYSENHPKMRQLRSQIEEAKKNLKEETLKIAKGENTIDPLSEIQKHLEEIATLEVEIHTDEAEEKALKKVLNSYNNSLSTLPQKELELGKLQRDKAVADEIYTMLLQKREEAKIKEAEKISNIRIIDPARIPRGPIRPRKKVNLLLGFFLGCTLGIGLALSLEVLDTSIKTVEDIEKLTNLPVIGTIPKIKNGSKEYLRQDINLPTKRKRSKIVPKLITIHDEQSAAAEAFRTLRTNLPLTEMSGSSPLKTILLTSGKPGEGKSFITANLAVSTAKLGLKTLIIDADLRKSTIHTFFNANLQPGLTDILKHLEKIRSTGSKIKKGTDEENDESVATTNLNRTVIQSTGIENLFLITSGTIPANPSELLASESMKNLNSKLKNNFDLIIYDLPPVIAVADAAVLAPEIDGIILVIEKGKNRPDEILRAKNLISKTNGNHIIGIVLNNVTPQGNYYAYYYNKNKMEKENTYEIIKRNINRIVKNKTNYRRSKKTPWK